MYYRYFIGKLSNSDRENTETQIWLDFSVAQKYISKEQYEELLSKSEEVGKLINYMINNSAKFN